MSRTIDERVVSMQFDNKQFESNVQTSLGTLEKLKQSLNFKGVSKSLDNIDSAVKKVDMSSLGNAAHTVGLRFSAMYTMADQALRNITNRVQYTAEHMIKSFTIDPVKTGLSEYETQIGAVQTILANTQSKGTTLDDVSGALDTLNKYADQTIYNFTEMTRNIGTFTAAGVDLDKSVTSIKGIANLAAVSGSTSQQASTAMYQLSQALAAGKVQLMDWNSVVNAGMGGQVFQDALKRTAKQMGTNVDELIKKYGSFRESLTQGEWLTAEVLTETLTQLSGAYTEADLIAQGYTESQAKEIVELSKTAVDAATKVKTFTQLMDTLKEAAQSGWTQTWELIVGDFEEAKELWTNVSEEIGGFINDVSENRNSLLKGALTSNWDKMIEKINAAGISTETFEDKVKATAKDAGYDIDKIIKHYGSLEKAFKSGAINSNLLKSAINGIGESIAEVDLSTITDNLKKGMKGDDVKKAQEALKALGHDLSKHGVDGIFGAETEAAVKAFQELNGLEITGIIDEATLAALDKAITKTSAFEGSIDDLVAGITELGGRELLIKSLANAWNAIKKPMVAVKEAWGDVFEGMKPEELYAIIKSFEEFTSKLIMSDESADKVRKTFKGLFSVLEVITTILGGGVKVAFKTLSKILEHFDLNILDVTAAAGDAMVAFRNWFFENNVLAKSFDKFIDGAVKAGVAIKNWIKNFIELPIVQKNIKRFQTAFSSAFKKIKTIFKDVGAIFGDFFTRLGTMDGFSLENVKMAFSNLVEKLKSYFSKLDVSAIFGGIANAFKKFKADAKKYLEGAGVKFDEIKEKIIAFVNIVKEKLGDNMGTILAVGVLLTFLFLVKKIKDAVELIAKPFDMVGDFLDGLGDTLKSFGKAAKAVAIKNIAISIAILAASVAVLAMLDQKKVWSSVGAIATMAGVLVGMSFLLSKFKPGDFGKLSVSLLGLAGSVLLMGIAAKTISGLDGTALLKTGAVLAAFLGVVVVVSKSTKGVSMWVNDFGKMMIKLSIALLLLSYVAKIFGKMDTGVLIQGGIAIAAFLGMMVVVMKSSSHISKNVAKFGSMMLGISAGLLLMGIAVKLLGNMELGEIVKGGIVMAAFLGVTILMSKITKTVGKDSAQFGKMMLGLSASLILMAFSIKILGSMDPETAVKGALAVAALLGVMALMMAATKLLGKNSGSAAKVGVMMLAFSGALLIMNASIAILGMMDAAALDKAISAVAKISLIFGGLVILSRFAGAAETCKGTIMTMSIAVAVLAVSMAALSFVDSSKLTGATVALGVVMGMFALLLGMTAIVKKATGTLLVMVGAIAILGGMLYLLAGLPIESTLGAASSLAILILSLSASCLLLSMVPVTGALTGIASLAIMIAGLGLIMAAITGLNRLFPDMESFLNESLPIIETIGSAIGSFVGGLIGGIAEGITSALPQIGTDLSNFMANLSPFIEGAKGIGEDTLTGVKNLASAILLITGASLLEGITSWITGGSSMGDFASQLVPFGEAIASFSSTVSGNVDEGAVTAAANAGKIMAEMASTLPNSGGVVGFFAGENDMATFASQLVPFGTAITSFSSIVSGNVDEGAVTAAANAGGVLAELAKKIPANGLSVVSVFAGEQNLATFADQLVPFGTAIASFSSAVSGNVDEGAVTAAANAGGVLAELANKIPATGLSVVSVFAGEKNLATFGSQLTAFGSAIVGFSSTVSGNVDETAVTAAANAGSMMAELSNKIPTTGGIWTVFSGDNNIAKFGEDLVAFGTAIKGFSDTVSGLDESAVTTAATAGTKLVDLANVLPESGGIWNVFSSNNDMSTFAKEIKKFGEGMKGFSDSVSGVETSTMTSAINAAYSLIALANSMATAGNSGDLSYLASGADYFGYNLKGFYDAVVDIDTSKINSIATSFSKLASVDFSGLSNISSTFTTVGSDTVDGFISSFSNASDRIKKAGESMITNFTTGVTNKKESVTNTFKTIATSGITGAKSKYEDFKDAGKYLVDGFADGIDTNTYKAVAKATAMAKAAVKAAEEALGIASPSKVFYKIGSFTGQGFVNALGDYEDKTYKAGHGIAESARSGLTDAISRIRDVIMNGVDDQITIRPVLDLSGVESGASTINGMFGTASVGTMAHVGAISTMMRNGQNETNSDVISAINDLGKKLGNISGNTYQINGVTYDDGSNVSEAVKSLIRAARVERRV